MQTLTKRTARQTEKQPQTQQALAYHFPTHAPGDCAGCDAAAERERILNWAKGSQR